MTNLTPTQRWRWVLFSSLLIAVCNPVAGAQIETEEQAMAVVHRAGLERLARNNRDSPVAREALHAFASLEAYRSQNPRCCSARKMGGFFHATTWEVWLSYKNACGGVIEFWYEIRAGEFLAERTHIQGAACEDAQFDK